MQTLRPQSPVSSSGEAPSGHDCEVARHAAFGAALDALRTEIEADLGARDSRHIRNVGRASRILEVLGRGAIHFSFEPLAFSLGVTSLWAHKCLELMEIGHMALHGSFDALPDVEAYQTRAFQWKAPIDEASWRRGHNMRHHKYTNIEGRDPDLSFGNMRLSPRVPYLAQHALQPLTNVLTWLGFANAINLHVTGMLDVYLPHGGAPNLSNRDPATVRAAKRAFARKFVRYYVREFGLFPALAGPLWWKTALGNALSEVGRDIYAGATVYCGHVGAKDYPEDSRPSSKGEWYAMQAEAARNVDVPRLVSVLSGALDRQIEHHLFPKLPPNRLREIAPRVRAICAEHGVQYLESSWPRTLREVFRELRRLGTPDAATTRAA